MNTNPKLEPDSDNYLVMKVQLDNFEASIMLSALKNYVGVCQKDMQRKIVDCKPFHEEKLEYEFSQKVLAEFEAIYIHEFEDNIVEIEGEPIPKHILQSIKNVDNLIK